MVVVDISKHVGGNTSLLQLANCIYHFFIFYSPNVWFLIFNETVLCSVPNYVRSCAKQLEILRLFEPEIEKYAQFESGLNIPPR